MNKLGSYLLGSFYVYVGYHMRDVYMQAENTVDHGYEINTCFNTVCYNTIQYNQWRI